jgi:hypothetical protein
MEPRVRPVALGRGIGCPPLVSYLLPLGGVATIRLRRARHFNPSTIRMRRLLTSAGLVATFSCLAAPLVAQTVTDSGTFVIRHNDTTVATEKFSRTETTLDGTLRLVNSRNTFHQYNLVVAPDATVPLVEVTVRQDADSGRIKARKVSVTRVIFKEDSAAVDAVIGEAIETRIFETRRGAVPYLNMSFALLEQALRRSKVGGTKEVPFFNLGGGQTLSGTITPLGGDSLNLAIDEVQFHLRVDRAGRVIGGSIPSQHVVVIRQ